MTNRLPLGALALALAAAPVCAQHPVVPKPPAAMSAIREADLKSDLYYLASDAMCGREAGTLDELRAAAWEAKRAREAGLLPAGDDGTYFQWWSMKRTVLSPASTIAVGDHAYALWTGMAATNTVAADVSAPTVFAGDGSDTTIDVRGKVAVATLAPPPPGTRQFQGVYTQEWHYARASVAAQSRELARRGAAAVILVADSVGEVAFQAVSVTAGRGIYDVDDAATNAAGGRYGGLGGGIPILYAHRSMLAELRASGQPAHIHLVTETFDYPSVNVVGIARGSDPKLRGEYVMFSSHTDHDGVRFPIDGDSIWNGADDNGSTSVALLAIARAFVKQPAKRSALFIWHGAEERGLLGSRYHSVHPVVPLHDIVAVLNGDLIGRNNPDTASLMGVQPPHRNSTDLVRMALEANAATGKFVLDSTWDRPTHPEGWYFRSDHVPYVRHGVPALMYSTNLHPDYHTPRDEPSRIDYAKLTRMTDWMYMTGWLVANAPRRPAVDPGFKLER
ncbi:MAG: M28 family peptidase [Gemmatimonadota bacterium]|nr:M28 family peptidase [Gemmatimonadota bacterium]